MNNRALKDNMVLIRLKYLQFFGAILCNSQGYIKLEENKDDVNTTSRHFRFEKDGGISDIMLDLYRTNFFGNIRIFKNGFVSVKNEKKTDLI